MNVYISASSRELERVRAAVALIEDEPGILITHRWWEAIEERHELGLGDGDLTGHEADQFWSEDVRGLEKADFVWYLVPEQPSEGAAHEVGYAVAIGMKVIASGPHAGGHLSHSTFHRIEHSDANAAQRLVAWSR